MRPLFPLLALVLFVETAAAQELLAAPDGMDRDRLGEALAMDADLIVVGAVGDDDGGKDSGSVYVFREGVSGYFFEQRFVAPDGILGDEFGHAVAVDADRVAVGAHFHPSGGEMRAGAVYLFRRVGGGWAFETKIEAFDAAMGARFGHSVALSGDTLAVGAHQDNQAGTKAGAVYVYRLIGASWTFEAKLFASDPMARDRFGNDVALEGDRLAVTAVLGEGMELDSGAAYVFERSGAVWTEQAKLIAPDGGYFHRFGASVCLEGDRLAVGAPIQDGSRGAAYVFARTGTTWALESRVEALDKQGKQRFGLDVALAGTTLYVGAPFRALQRPAVYSFERVGTTWTPRGKHSPPLAQTGSLFGTSVAADGARIAAGAPQTAAGRGVVLVIDERPISALCPPQSGRLIPADGAPGLFFGLSLAADGDVLAVGAPAANLTSGSVNVFERTGSDWNLDVRPTALAPEPNDRFGAAVDVCGDVMAVTLRGGVGVDSDVYVYRRSPVGGWALEERLANLVGAMSSLTNFSVSLDATRLAVGAPVTTDVYVVNHSGGNVVLEATIPSPVSGFGHRVALSDPYLFVGRTGLDVTVYVRSGTTWSFSQLLGGTRAEDMHATSDELFWGAPGIGNQVGQVFVYERAGSTWCLAQTLQASGAQAGDRFGHRLDLGAGRLVVAAPGADRVHLFAREGGAWTEVQALPGAVDDVAVTDEVLAIGFSGDNPAGVSSGSVALYEPALFPATYCTGKTSSLGCVPFVSTAGLPSAASTQPFQVLGGDLIPGQAGFLLYGTDRAGIRFHGATLCVKGNVRRLLPAKAATPIGPPPCTGVLRVDFGAHVSSGNDPLLTVGRRVTAQWYQRDALDPAGFGDVLSDAVSFLLCP